MLAWRGSRRPLPAAEAASTRRPLARMSTSDLLGDAGNRRRLFPGIPPEPRSTLMATLSIAARRVVPRRGARRLVRAAVRASGRGARRSEEHHSGERSATGQAADRGAVDVHRVSQPGRRRHPACRRRRRHRATSDPTVDRNSVNWPMPTDLPKGAYVVTWRVVSSDEHPISGASSFGSRAAAAVVQGSRHRDRDC